MIHRQVAFRRLTALPALALALVVAALLTAATARAAETVHLYVGEVAETNAFIAIATDGTRVKAYLCDGTREGVTLWGWFDGILGESSTDLVSTNGLVLRVGGGVVNHDEGITGTITLRDGVTATFSTVSAEGEAAFWQYQGVVNGDPVLAGWIVLADGQQRGAMNRRGTIATVEPVDSTGAVSIDGVELDSAGFHIHINPF